jgi:hypothetical protein
VQFGISQEFNFGEQVDEVTRDDSSGTRGQKNEGKGGGRKAGVEESNINRTP